MPDTPQARLSTVEEVQEALKDDAKVQLAGVDVDGVLRGKVMTKSKFFSSLKGGFGYCSVVFGWDMLDTVYSKELEISNLANGYQDLIARIDLGTYRRLPISATETIPFFLVTFYDPDTNETLSVCPRGLLQRVVGDLASEGLMAFAGAEFEYFQFKETAESIAAKDYHKLTPLTAGMHGYSLLRPALNSEYFHSIYDESAKFGIEIEGHHTETGPGVYETALAYTDVERMADNAILFKFLAKLMGQRHGIMPTFMAKPYGDLPGCSGHIHISLRGKDGKNLFAVEDSELQAGRADASFKDTKRISQTAEHFLAGVLKGLPDIMPCLLPNVNSYKRLVESFWAPTSVSYAYENRVASVRIISPPLADPAATRLEVRVPGADMNPYFAYSAVLACGLAGIKAQLPLSQAPINTSAMSVAAAESAGDAPFKDLVKLPKTLCEATARMKAEGSVARQVLGDAFVNHFAATRENEWNLYAQAVTDWELKRYLELA